MDEYAHRWMVSYGWFFICDLDSINKSLDEIHPWLENKEIQNYLYPFSLVVKVLIFQTWMSIINDG
jgi:hypothetical protein